MKTTPLHDWISTKIGVDQVDFGRSAVERYQLERIQQVIKNVSERSPFYRELFAGLVTPKTLLDFCEFPFTTAEDLRADPSRFVCVSQDEIHRIVTLPTSGTTGPTKRIYFTAADQELTIDFFQAGMSTLSAPGDRVLILLPVQREGSVGDLLRIGLQRLHCIPFPHGPFENEGEVLQLIRDNDINILVGTPIQLHRLLRWDQAFSIIEHGQIKKVLTSTDILPETIRMNLQTLWGCEVFDHYGMTETGLGGGVECAAHCGYHLRDADLYFEIIDHDTGQKLPEGQVGEVVVTTLTRVGMPLIRYRTGDISRLIPGVCSCGSFITRLEKIHSRILSGVETKSGILYPSELDDALFKLEPILDFSATLELDASSDLLHLDMLMIDGEINDFENLIQNLVSTIPAIHCGLHNGTLHVLVNHVETLPSPGRGMNKRKIIIK